MPTSWKSNPSQKPNPDSLDDASWTDSAIFGIGSLVGASFLDPPSIDVNASSMDESRLRLAASVFANTHDGIVITDATGCILDINRAYAKISGYSSEEVIGKMPDFLKSNVSGQPVHLLFSTNRMQSCPLFGGIPDGKTWSGLLAETP